MHETREICAYVGLRLQIRDIGDIRHHCILPHSAVNLTDIVQIQWETRWISQFLEHPKIEVFAKS